MSLIKNSLICIQDTENVPSSSTEEKIGESVKFESYVKQKSESELGISSPEASLWQTST